MVFRWALIQGRSRLWVPPGHGPGGGGGGGACEQDGAGRAQLQHPRQPLWVGPRRVDGRRRPGSPTPPLSLTPLPHRPSHHEAGGVAHSVRRRKRGADHQRHLAGPRRRLSGQRQAALGAQERARVGRNRNLHTKAATRLLPSPVDRLLCRSPHGCHSDPALVAQALCAAHCQQLAALPSPPPALLVWACWRCWLPLVASAITGAALTRFRPR